MLFRGGTTTAIIVIFPIEVSQKFTGRHVGRAYLGGAVNLHSGIILLCYVLVHVCLYIMQLNAERLYKKEKEFMVHNGFTVNKVYWKKLVSIHTDYN